MPRAHKVILGFWLVFIASIGYVQILRWAHHHKRHHVPVVTEMVVKDCPPGASCVGFHVDKLEPGESVSLPVHVEYVCSDCADTTTGGPNGNDKEKP